ncbi:MAG TPA: hypothetical protein VG274_06735 [Rhizomicrobium sp.]|nr:hypothetical protein [Rhizomicrobium sp.]
MHAAEPMSRQGSEFDGQVKERSGWLLPIAVFVVTAVLSALFLLYYLAPNPGSFIEEHPQPTSRTDAVKLWIGGIPFTIPANYLLYPGARKGGARREVALYAALPDFRGYSDADGPVFSGNNAGSPIVYMLIREEAFNLPEATRLQRIYLNDVIDVRGRKAPFGLVQYEFRNDSGYRGEDLFVGQIGRGVVVMHCVRLSQNVPSPSCLRDTMLARGVALSYRFKRSQLASWRDIANGADRLVASFRVPGK